MVNQNLPLSSLTTHELPPVQELTKWANPPDLTKLRADVTTARPKLQEHRTRVAQARAIIDITGDNKPKSRKGRSAVQPKLVRKTNEWRYSSLSESVMSAEQLFQLSPRTFEDADAARQHSVLLNYQYETFMNKVHLIDTSVRKLVDTGVLGYRVSWVRTTKKVKKVVPKYNFFPLDNPEDPIAAEQMPIIQQALEQYQANPASLKNAPEVIQEAVKYFVQNQMPVYAEQIGTEQVEVDEVMHNHPMINVIDTRNLYIDPSCNERWWEAHYMVYVYESCYADLKASGRYQNLESINWAHVSTVALDSVVDPTNETHNFSEKARRRVPVYEYYGKLDIHGTGELVPVLITWVDNVIIQAVENPYPDKQPPFVLTPFMPVEGMPHGDTDAELLEDNQRILGATVRGMIDLMGRSANGQTGMPKGFLDAPNKLKYNNGEDYEYNQNINPAQYIHTHKFPEIPNSAFNMINYVTMDSESLVGVKNFHNGLSSASYGDVAAGTKGVMNAAAQRESSIVRRMRAGLQMVAYKIIAMNSIFLTDEEIVDVTNEANVVIRREDLQFSNQRNAGVNVKINIQSQAELESRAQELSFMMQTMGPNMEFGIQKMMMVQQAELRRMPELANQLRNYEPQPDPLDQQIKQLEIEKLRSEIARNNAQAAAAEANARKQHSEADITDLSYVQDQTGESHQRELDHSRAQAAGNQDLAITKSLAKVGEQTGDFMPAAVHADATQVR